MPDKFQSDDRVFAKIKGWPPWPAKVLNRVEGKGESYMILFYGTYDTSVVKPDSMYPYNDDNKAKYGKPKNSNRWKEAMDEIANNTPIGEAGPLEEAPAEKMDVDNDTDGDGELMIDEGPPAQPPVLTKEVSKAPVASNQNGKSEQPQAKAPARRGSKASLSKRDSISSTSSATEVSTPAAAATPPGTELVSRSGRKIKPKRFADDEISTPTPTKNKNSSQDDSSEGPPTKRAKRGGKTPPAASKSTPVAEPKEPAPSRPRMVIGKGKGAPQKTPPVSGRVSPDISSPVPVPKAPALKPAAAAASQRKSDAPPPQPGKKPLPALIPAAGSAVAIQQQHTAPAAIPPGRRAPSLRQQARQDVITDEESENEGPPILAMGVDEVEADDKENLKDGAPSSNGSEMESESEMEKNSEMDETSSRYSEAFDESLMKLRFTDKEGEPYEIRVESKETFESEEEQKEYDNTLQTIVKLKEDLEQGDQETHETLQELLEANRDEFDPQEATDRERRANQIRTLRIEGEVIEIIGEIVSCLGERQAEVARAYELLDRLGTHELTALILKKHPEVVHTVSRLRNYVGNVEQWDMTEDQAMDFKEGAQMIRQKASEIYCSFYNVFIAPEEQDSTVPFEEIFKEEMKLFKEQTMDLTLDEVLGLTAETDNGGFEMFDVGEIEA